MKNKKEEEQLAAAILKYMRSTGYLFPESEDEVESFERLFGHEKVELPKSLKDSSFLFKKKCP